MAHLLSCENETATSKVGAARHELENVEPSDYVAILDAQARVRDLEQQVGLEDRWLRLTEMLS